MTAEASRAPRRDRRAGAGLDRDALSAPGELPRGGDRLPRTAARTLARDARGRSRRRCRATRPTGRSRGGQRGPAGGGGAAPDAVDLPSRGAGRRRGAADARRRGGEARRAFSPRSPLGHATLIHAYSGHGVVESPLTPAWARRIAGVFRFPDRRCVMATLLLAAAGSALGGAVGGSVAGIGAMALGKAAGAIVGSVLDQRLLGARIGAGGDRARRAVPRDGLERGRAAGAGLRALPGGGAGDLVEPVPGVGALRAGRRQGWRRWRHRARVQLLGEPCHRALRGRGARGSAGSGPTARRSISPG